MGQACTSRVPPSYATKREARASSRSRVPPFLMPAGRPCCTRPFVGKQSYGGGGAPSYSPRGRRKRGEGGALRERRVFPLQGLPLAHHQEGGVSTTPHVVPRARPLRTPPFACHPAHAVPHAGRRRVAPERWGAGVVHTERTRGRAHTQCGRGARFPWPPPVRMSSGSARPLCTRTGAGRKGGGSTPV